ncbi:MarR family transcriptional regulator [Cognatiyoonia sp. IB215182]|uniref:MarR family winged helix-turn-helix transcriptional regulator n=1 Tax=Cognatiyoonia sp. IB215182 TaxID=3097353 RepID=UPI002A0F3F85|nr:MarR family transcriptional regulator [Cognatiyoonia sp. IB215182]MDX8352640.1 MarR family transcriptional regulator [Cognatiyoonia sp. IB215182]
MSLTPGSSAGYLVNHLARLFAAALQDRIKPLGLSTGVFPIMLHLWQKDGLTQSDLVTLVGIEQATMANTLARMERDGLILRRPDPDDGRSKRIFLTEVGRAKQTGAMAAANAANADIMAALTTGEREQMMQLLRKAIEGKAGQGRQSQVHAE